MASRLVSVLLGRCHRVRAGGKWRGSSCSAWRSSSASVSRRCSWARHADGSVRRHRRARRLRAGRGRRLSARARARLRGAALPAGAAGAGQVGRLLGRARRRHRRGDPACTWRSASIGCAAIRPGGVLGEYGAELLVVVRRPRRRGAVRRGAAGGVAGAVDVAVVPRDPVAARVAPGAARSALFTRGLALIFPAHDDDDDDEERRSADVEEKPAEAAARQEGAEDATVAERPTPRSTRPTSSAAEKALDAMAQMKTKARKRDDEPQVVKLRSEPPWRCRASARPAPAAPRSQRRSRTRQDRAQRARPAPIADELGPEDRRAAGAQEEGAGAKAPERAQARLHPGGGRLPPARPSLLDYEESHDDEIDKSAMLALADKLQKTLADYGVKGSVAEIHPGPVVTMYEFVPAPGTKLSKITGAVERSGDGAGGAARAHRRADPGQGLGRHRGAEQDARDGVPEGDPRRRARAEGQVAS